MSRITRRLLLASTASVALAAQAARAGVFPRGGVQAGGGGGGNLTLEVTFPGGVPTGSTVVFDQSAGTNIGDYVAPTAGFTQHCIRSTNASIPYMFVDFRPDATGGRVEVVVWYGHVDPSGGTVASGFTAATLSKYTAVVKQNGIALKSYTIPFHYWGTRWRHQSATRTVIRTPSQVFSQGWVPNITTTSARLTGYTGVIVPPDPPDVPATNPTTGNPCWYPFDPPSDLVATGTLAIAASAGDTSVTVSAPSVNAQAFSVQLANGVWQTFSNASLDQGLTVLATDKPLVENASNGAAVHYHAVDCSIFIANDNGGDRGEEGIITEWQAEYLLKSTDPTRGPISLNNLIQQAEMMGSQWQSSYLSDLATNGPINYRTDQARWITFTRVWQAFDGGFSPPYYLVRGGPRNSVYNNNAGGTEHGGNYFYIPYILTEDPYFLEALQYQHQLEKGFDISSKDGTIGNGATDPTGASCICGIRGQWSYTAEPRDIGWGVRNTASSYACSPTSPPSWLLPQSAYGEAGYNQSKLINLRLTTSTNTFQTIYHNPCQVDFLQLFETSYFIMSLSLASKVGLVTTSPVNGATSTPWSTHINFFIQQFSDVCAPYTISGGSPVSLTGSISGNVLTVSAISSGTLQVGQSLTGSGIQLNTWIMSQLTGTAGSTGTYTVNSPQTIGSESMTAIGAMGTTGWNIQACQITNIHYPAFDSTANPTNYYTSLGNAWTGPATPASAPTLTSVAAGSLGAATYFVVVTYVDTKDSFPVNVTTVGQYGASNVAWGETTASPETSLAVAANHVVKVTSPPKVDGSGYYNVYISTATGTETLQTPWNTVGGVVNGPIPIGTDWTMPTSGLVTGAALPANSTTGLGEFFLAFPSNAPPLYVQPNSSTSNLSPMVAACGAAKSVSTTGAASPFSYLNTMIDATYPNIDFTTAFAMRYGFDGT